MNELYLLAINLTRRCNLACAHCYLDAETKKNGSADELSTEELSRLLDEVANQNVDSLDKDEAASTMIVLTGGEPLLRADLETLVTHGTTLGLSMVIGTNGTMLTDKRVASLKTAGAMGVGISLDSLNAVRHDKFRGKQDAWEKTLMGMEACRRHDLPFQIHFSVTESNAHEVPAMIDFAHSVDARVLNVFFLICTGRGETMSDITPQTYEDVLQQLVTAQEKTQDLIIRARCAPHFKRVAYQHNPRSTLTRAQGYEGGGCLAGIHYCRITPEGDVTACPYIPETEGNVRHTPFWQIWKNSATFQQLRNPILNGKCGQCEYTKLCGGCRARPLAIGGDIMDADPWCNYQPGEGETIQPLIVQANKIDWTAEAQQRLTRVPAFLRKMVKKRTEEFAIEQFAIEKGSLQVTEQHLATLATRQFGDKGPPRPQSTADVSTNATNTKTLPWSEQAWERLQAMPGFLRQGVQQVAEDLACSEGRLEVNVKLLDRLEADDEPGRRLSWSPEADQALQEILKDKSSLVKLFIASALENDAERITKKRRAVAVSLEDVEKAILPLTGGVEWAPDAYARVASAPEFNRAGIKKAAEFNARREGLQRITSEDLTRFRNRAMMRAVQRMKGFGMQELSFDAFEIARTRVPRLRDNVEAEKRFNTIRKFVQKRKNPGELLGQKLLGRMKQQLKNNTKKMKRVKNE